jgi:hypothetical protein
MVVSTTNHKDKAMHNDSPEPTPLTLLSPIKNGCVGDQSHASLTRAYLQSLTDLELSPMAQVPNTFLCRFCILDDAFYEGFPAEEDHLQSNYLVFCCNFHGDLDTYLAGFWDCAREHAQNAWKYCVAFDQVNDAASFIAYIKRCLVKTTFYFNGSSGAPLQEQLKALYLKQEVSQFACDHQGMSPERLRAAFREFVARTRPNNLDGPTWKPGMNELPKREASV